MDAHPQSRRREDLAAAIVRELSPPTVAVAAITDLLARQPLPADAAVCVRSLVEEVRLLTRRLRDAADLVGAPGWSEESDVPLRRFLDGLAGEGAPVLVSYEGEADLAVRADAERLRRVFDAAAAQVRGSAGRAAVEVRLTARRRDGRIRLTARLRGEAGRTPGPDGLALMLGRRLVEGWGGALTLEPNAGSGQTATLHLELPEAVAAVVPATMEPEDAAPGLHVLIVDDNATNRMVAEAFCEMFGCTSESAADGVEALEAVRVRRFDVILMDVKMPRMDGVEATLAIRALPGPERDTPILALTANADPDDVRRYRAAGMASVIEKPIKADRLAAALHAVAAGELPEMAAAA